jgi:PPM family protein phosphatase
MTKALGNTNVGMVRKINQDSFLINKENSLFVVADGMGGHLGGEVASSMAVNLIDEYFTNQEGAPHELSQKAIENANTQIREEGNSNSKVAGMGTTVVMGHIHDNLFILGNVGDSRCYLVQDKKLYQLSRDHSLVQEKLRIGIYNRQQAQKDPQKNILVRTVGVEAEVEVDVFEYKYAKGDIMLLCSDGLHGKVLDQDIIKIVNESIPNPLKTKEDELQQCTQKLIDAANKNGGNDNITALLIVVD